MTKITIDRATVEQALEAVEALEGLSNWEERILGRICENLRQALEQPNEFHPDWEQEPRREWVGLTDEEIAGGQRQSWVDKQAFESAAWWAEAKLREKNT